MEITSPTGKKVKIEFHDYKKGDMAMMTIMVYQESIDAYVVIMDENLNQEF